MLKVNANEVVIGNTRLKLKSSDQARFQSLFHKSLINENISVLQELTKMYPETCPSDAKA